MMDRLAALSLVGLMLAGCAAQVTPSRQYLLDYPALGDITLASDDRAPALLLDQVGVAPFLDASGIVLQTADNRISVAGQNRWAEPIERQLRRSLYAVLVKRLDNVAIFEHPPAAAEAARLSVSLDAFQGHYTGEAVIAGSWRLTGADGAILARQRFRMERSLPGDGYTPLVRTLSEGWHRVAARIAGDVKPLLASP